VQEVTPTAVGDIRETAAADVLVSIVVPVYNAGSFLDGGARSLLHQSIGVGAYEVIYVDDGSTDGSGERLDELAARHPQVRVHHQPNSGWPGKPRNVGIKLARGKYIQFVDQDDELGLEALERLYAMAERNDSDVVLGKLVGTMVGPRRVYRRTVERGTVADSDVVETLTSHKMFRREFLLRHDIRFPEGYWRGEDLLFLTKAYARAEVVSILADYPCYYWNRRDDGGNNSMAPYDLAGHYERLRVIIDAVYDNTEPGPRQDRLLGRMYGAGVLDRVSEPGVLSDDQAAMRQAFEESRAIAVDRFPPRIREAMAPVAQTRATLLEQGDLPGLREFARRIAEIKPVARVASSEWRDGKLHVSVRASLRLDGEPLQVVERDGRYALDPRLTAGLPGAEQVTFEDPLADAWGDLVVHVEEGHVFWWANSELTPRLEPLGGGRHQVVLGGVSVLDPARLAGNAPLGAGEHRVWLFLRTLGVRRRPAIGIPRRLLAAGGAVTPENAMLVRADTVRAGAKNQLQLVVRPAGQAAVRALTRGPLTGRSSFRPSRRPLVLPLSEPAGLPPSRVALPGREVSGELVSAGEASHLILRRATSLPTGRHRVTFGRKQPVLTVLVARSRILGAVGQGHRGVVRFLLK
jgi:hypothetical protein